VLSTEAAIMEGKGRLTPTGKLGEVMQESAQAAMSYIRSRAHQLGLPKDFLPQHRYSLTRSGRRHPQGRPVRRHHDLHIDRQRAHQKSSAPPTSP